MKTFEFTSRKLGLAAIVAGGALATAACGNTTGSAAPGLPANFDPNMSRLGAINRVENGHLIPGVFSGAAYGDCLRDPNGWASMSFVKDRVANGVLGLSSAYATDQDPAARGTQAPILEDGVAVYVTAAHQVQLKPLHGVSKFANMDTLTTVQTYPTVDGHWVEYGMQNDSAGHPELTVQLSCTQTPTSGGVFDGE